MEKVVARDAHYTGSASKWKKYYTQEIGDAVYELYKTDFEAFGYQREVFQSLGSPDDPNDTMWSYMEKLRGEGGD